MNDNINFPARGQEDPTPPAPEPDEDVLVEPVDGAGEDVLTSDDDEEYEGWEEEEQ